MLKLSGEPDKRVVERLEEGFAKRAQSWISKKWTSDGWTAVAERCVQNSLNSMVGAGAGYAICRHGAEDGKFDWRIDSLPARFL